LIGIPSKLVDCAPLTIAGVLYLLFRRHSFSNIQLSIEIFPPTDGKTPFERFASGASYSPQNRITLDASGMEHFSSISGGTGPSLDEQADVFSVVIGATRFGKIVELCD
jgi:hypothetical protein